MVTRNRVQTLKAAAHTVDDVARRTGVSPSSLTYSHDAANVLFHVVNERHIKKKSMIFTTNKPFSSWGAVRHDEDLAQAILDRVFEHGRHIKLGGPSIRTLHLDGILPTADNQQARVFRNAGLRVFGTHMWLLPLTMTATTR